MAVELHGQLRRRDVLARSRCGRFALARDRGRAPLLGAADPCQYANTGKCDVPLYCAAGDYLDCRTVGPVVSGTLPDAIGSLACRSKITRLCARPPSAALVPTAFTHPCKRPACTSPPTRSARRVFAGYPGLIGTVPPTISALTALTYMYVPLRGRAPADAADASLRERAAAARACGGCAWAASSVWPHVSL